MSKHAVSRHAGPRGSRDPTPADLDHNYTEANRILVAFTKHGDLAAYREAALFLGFGYPVAAAGLFLYEHLHPEE